MCRFTDACVYYLSSLPCDAYELLEKVFSMFAEGNIKGQNCPRGSVGKKLDLKGCNFKPMRGLDMSTIASLMERMTEELSKAEDPQGAIESFCGWNRCEDMGRGREVSQVCECWGFGSVYQRQSVKDHQQQQVDASILHLIKHRQWQLILQSILQRSSAQCWGKWSKWQHSEPWWHV